MKCGVQGAWSRLAEQEFKTFIIGGGPILKRVAIWSGLVGLPLVLGTAPAFSQSFTSLKMGIVDIAKAIKASKAYKRELDNLQTAYDKKKGELDLNKVNFEKKVVKFNNQKLMLRPSQRAEQGRKLVKQKQALRRENLLAQRELQARKQKIAKTIYLELKAVVPFIAKNGKFDLILEKGGLLIILYSSKKFEDITNQVIRRYDRSKDGN